jgi:hypothetical protein
MALGWNRSATFRSLVRELDDTHVVVYVRLSRCRSGVASCLLFASPPGGPRRLLIKVDRFHRSEHELTVLLGHELQHACEVASDPDITDPRSFQRAFERRGWKGPAGFETARAQEIARRVAAELMSYGGGAGSK